MSLSRHMTLMAQLCAQSGASFIHIDCPERAAPAELATVIGDEHLGVLERDQEVQILMTSAPQKAGQEVERMMLDAISVLERHEVLEANVWIVKSSGHVARWSTGQAIVSDRLERDLLDAAYERRARNTA